MQPRFRPTWIVIATMVIAATGAATISAFRPKVESAFVAENSAAMDRMMQRMHAGRSGDADRDFAATMIPHHQGAIDMALAQIRHGRNERLRRLAQGIVVEQQQEIVALRAVLDEEFSPVEEVIAPGSLCRSSAGP